MWERTGPTRNGDHGGIPESRGSAPAVGLHPRSLTPVGVPKPVVILGKMCHQAALLDLCMLPVQLQGSVTLREHPQCPRYF